MAKGSKDAEKAPGSKSRDAKVADIRTGFAHACRCRGLLRRLSGYHAAPHQPRYGEQGR